MTNTYFTMFFTLCAFMMSGNAGMRLSEAVNGKRHSALVVLLAFSTTSASIYLFKIAFWGFDSIPKMKTALLILLFCTLVSTFTWFIVGISFSSPKNE